VSPVKYELGFYIPEDDILHSYRRENLKSYFTDLFVDFNQLSVTKSAGLKINKTMLPEQTNKQRIKPAEVKPDNFKR
jgi:hypothetical protein